VHNMMTHKAGSKVHSFITLAVVRGEWLNWYPYHLGMSLKITLWYRLSSCFLNHSKEFPLPHYCEIC